MVMNRADVVASLEEAGFLVPRQGKDYLTASNLKRGNMAAEKNGAPA